METLNCVKELNMEVSAINEEIMLGILYKPHTVACA